MADTSIGPVEVEPTALSESGQPDQTNSKNTCPSVLSENVRDRGETSSLKRKAISVSQYHKRSKRRHKFYTRSESSDSEEFSSACSPAASRSSDFESSPCAVPQSRDSCILSVSSNDSDSNVSDSNTDKVKQKKNSDSSYSRFDISDDIIKPDLPSDMVDYVEKKFTSFIPDKVLNEKILDNLPVPGNISVSAQPVDNYIPEIFDSVKRSYGKPYDVNLSAIHVQNRVGTVMGPLSKLWSDLDSIRSGKAPSDSLDLFSSLDLVEKSITLLGQAYVSTTYNRRMNILYNLTKDVRKAKHLLKSNSDKLNATGSLFGKRFYKSLVKSSATSKASREISKTLGAAPKKKVSNSNSNFQRHRKSFADQDTHDKAQPFQYRAPSRGARGGGRTVSFRRRGRGTQGPHSGKRVTFIRTSASTNKASTTRSLQSGSKSSSQSNFKLKVKRCGSRSSSGRENKTSHRKLEVADTRSSHTRTGTRFKNSILGNSSSKFFKKHISDWKPGFVDRCRDNIYVRKNGNKASTTLCRSISEPCLFSPKERWGTTSSHKSKASQYFCGIPTFQDGGYSVSEVLDKERGFHGEIGLEGCLLHSSSLSLSQEVPPIPLERENVRISCNAFRSCTSSPLFHKTDETSDSVSQKTGHQTGHLSGRHDYIESVTESTPKGHELPAVIAGAIRVSHKLEEINADSFSDFGISRFSSEFNRDDIIFTSNQNSEDSGKMPNTSFSKEGYSAGSVRSFRSYDSFITSSRSCPPTLQTLTNVTHSDLVEEQVLPGNHLSKSSMFRGVEMVDMPDDSLEWQIYDYPRPGFDNSYRCFEKGVGGNTGSIKGPRSVDSIREPMPHKYPGIEGRFTGIENIYQECSENTCSHENGQHDCSCVHSKDGRYKVSSSSDVNSRYMELLSEEGFNFDGRVPSGDNEYRGRLAVQKLPRQQRLEVTEECLQGIECSPGSFQVGLVCQSPQRTVTKVCQLASRPICNNSGCIPDVMERGRDIHVPSFFYDSQVSVEDPTGNCLGNSDCATMANESLVSHDTGYVNTTPSTFTPMQGPVDGAFRGGPPIVVPDKLQVSGMENLRQQVIDSGVSEGAASLLAEHSWRKGTTVAYNSSWRQWCTWCNKRQVDPFRSPVADVINYLSERYDNGDSYRTLNCRRSAISAFHTMVDGVKVGQHDLVRRFLTATFNARPPQPRYVVTWDVEKVLTYLKSLGVSNSLSDKLLTLKLAMLMALASASRSSELTALDTQFMLDKDDEVNFQLGKLTKSRKVGQSPLKVTFQIFEKEPLLCVVTTLRCYLDRSKSWRRRKGLQRHQLFLSYVEPHKPVVSCTVAGWLVNVLSLAGVDTSEFKAHSTRGAATSKAKAMGLSCKDILEMARWSKVQTFKKHYLRDTTKVSKNEFQRAVLS